MSPLWKYPKGGSGDNYMGINTLIRLLSLHFSTYYLPAGASLAPTLLLNTTFMARTDFHLPVLTIFLFKHFPTSFFPLFPLICLCPIQLLFFTAVQYPGLPFSMLNGQDGLSFRTGNSHPAPSCS